MPFTPFPLTCYHHVSILSTNILAYYVPGTILGTGKATINKKTNIPVLKNVMFQWGSVGQWLKARTLESRRPGFEFYFSSVLAEWPLGINSTSIKWRWVLLRGFSESLCRVHGIQQKVNAIAITISSVWQKERGLPHGFRKESHLFFIFGHIVLHARS